MVDSTFVSRRNDGDEQVFREFEAVPAGMKLLFSLLSGGVVTALACFVCSISNIDPLGKR